MERSEDFNTIDINFDGLVILLYGDAFIYLVDYVDACLKPLKALKLNRLAAGPPDFRWRLPEIDFYLKALKLNRLAAGPPDFQWRWPEIDSLDL